MVVLLPKQGTVYTRRVETTTTTKPHPGKSPTQLFSLFTAVMKLPVTGNIYLITAVAVLGGSLFGFDISSMSAILGTDQYRCYFNQGDPNDAQCAGPHADVQGGIVAAMAGGSWLGAITSGFISDIMGRKYAIIVGSIIWYVSLVVSFSFSYRGHSN